eukprot:2733418-Amphidinium_carterae.1
MMKLVSARVLDISKPSLRDFSLAVVCDVQIQAHQSKSRKTKSGADGCYAVELRRRAMKNKLVKRTY